MFSDPKSGRFTFKDFLFMVSVFSEYASDSLKREYAFKIYDFDDDDKLAESDLREVRFLPPLSLVPLCIA